MQTFTTRGARLLLPVALVGALAVGLSSPVRAEQPTAASGTYMLTSRTLTPLRTADGNSFTAVVETPAYAGDITGTATDTYTLITHADGSFNAQGTETCVSCSIGGRTGDFTANFAFKGTAAGGSGRLTFTGGTGGLTGLHGGGTFQGTSVGTYAYDYHFAP
jgi:hypothetical protein